MLKDSRHSRTLNRDRQAQSQGDDGSNREFLYHVSLVVTVDTLSKYDERLAGGLRVNPVLRWVDSISHEISPHEHRILDI